jgi:hypothetical protein
LLPELLVMMRRRQREQQQQQQQAKGGWGRYPSPALYQSVEILRHEAGVSHCDEPPTGLCEVKKEGSDRD